jgi:hypothetical protein
MLSRIRSPRGLPSIRRPRAVAAALAFTLALTASSAFAQRGGGGCAGISGGTGGPGLTSGSTSGVTGGLGGVGTGSFGSGSFGTGQLNSMALASSTQFTQPMQGLEGMFLIPWAGDEVNLDGNHQAQLAARKAIRAAQLEERRAQREAFRPERKSRVVATRTRPLASR